MAFGSKSWPHLTPLCRHQVGSDLTWQISLLCSFSLCHATQQQMKFKLQISWVGQSTRSHLEKNAKWGDRHFNLPERDPCLKICCISTIFAQTGQYAAKIKMTYWWWLADLSFCSAPTNQTWISSMRRVAPASQAERANKKYFQQILKAHQHNLDSRWNLAHVSQVGVGWEW